MDCVDSKKTAKCWTGSTFSCACVLAVVAASGRMPHQPNSDRFEHCEIETEAAAVDFAEEFIDARKA
jgi:hypothetical protein